jgi:hypothetical protein
MLVSGERDRPMDESILVAVAGAHDIVDAGVRTLLADDSGIVVMERFPDFGTIPDVIVYDAIGIEEDGGAEVTALAKESESAVLVMSRDLRPDLAARAMAHGDDPGGGARGPGVACLGACRVGRGGRVDASGGGRVVRGGARDEQP